MYPIRKREHKYDSRKFQSNGEIQSWLICILSACSVTSLFCLIFSPLFPTPSPLHPYLSAYSLWLDSIRLTVSSLWKWPGLVNAVYMSSFKNYFHLLTGSIFPGGSDGKSICLQCRRPRFDPWVRKIPWRRQWQPTPVLLPGKSHGWRSVVGCNPWGRKESDMTERLLFLSFFFF